MAVEQTGIDITMPAAADLSGAQFRFMIVDTNGRATVSGANGKVLGILQNKPNAAGAAARVRISGVSKLQLGNAGTAQQYVASNAQGFGTTASNTGDWIGAQVLTNVGGSGDITDVALRTFHY